MWVIIKRAVFILFLMLSIGLPQTSYALTFPLPPKGTDIVGQIFTVYSEPGDNLSLIGRLYDIGLYEMIEANPGLGTGILPRRTQVIIPNQFILPRGPRRGIVINLAEMRIYYYPPKKNIVITNPIGIGRVGWATPTMSFKIKEKKIDPEWNVPKTVREESAALGYPLPKVVPPGPDNPLGRYAMRLNHTSYLIHSTNRPEGIGTRATAGCIRMLPEDIERIFHEIKLGTPVEIVNQAYKVGWSDGDLYLEAHLPLNEERAKPQPGTHPAVKAIFAATKGVASDIDWDLATRIGDEHRGIPTIIGTSYYQLSHDDY